MGRGVQKLLFSSCTVYAVYIMHSSFYIYIHPLLDAYALANGAMVKQYHWPDAADSMESSIDYLLQTVAKQKPYVQFLLGFGCGW